ncbi:MAG: 50S ribosomal protein L29 [Deltaproteobacteria bacterium]
MSKAKELREMSDDQLEFSLREAKESLFNLRFQASTEKLDAPSNLKKTRREIARINTILRERQLAKEAPGAGK